MRGSLNIARRVDVYVGMYGYRSVPTDVPVSLFIADRVILQKIALSYVNEIS